MVRNPPPPRTPYRVQCCANISLRSLGKEGLTPETFWEHSERLVELAEGGDRSGFESAVAELLAGNKKIVTSSSSRSSSDHVADSSGRRSGPHNEPTGSAMSTSAAQILGQSGSAGRGSPSGAEGVDGGEGDAWQPGGQELHAVLGNTGAGGTYTRKSGYIRESHQPGEGGRRKKGGPEGAPEA